MSASRFSCGTSRSITFTKDNLRRDRGVYHRFIEANLIVR
jgi:hypothetical protein